MIMKTIIILLAVLVVWSVLAQSCMQFRISDDKAKKRLFVQWIGANDLITVNEPSMDAADKAVVDDEKMDKKPRPKRKAIKANGA